MLGRGEEESACEAQPLSQCCGRNGNSRPSERAGNELRFGYVDSSAVVLCMVNDNGHTSNDPFKQYKIAEIVYGTPIYITTDERKQLAEADMGDDKQLETQRDIFVFQCMIGCRVSDLYKMTYANIIGDCIEYVPRKTRDYRVVTVSVPRSVLRRS